MTIYIVSVFLSAFLLFQIQPLVGKLILPWFGGTSAVWSTIMLFFQTLLTGGYAYAYWLVGLKSQSKQNRSHLLLLVASLIILVLMSIGGSSPITPDLSLRPTNPQHPVWEIIKLLFLIIGLPGFVLSANSTLIQTWFIRNNPKKSPYWLYSLSNAGSLLALVTYPILFEPKFSLQTQSWVWAGGYLIFGLITGFLITRLVPRAPSREDHSLPHEVENKTKTIRRRHQIMWLSLSATASILLLSTTSLLTQEVAPIPLLWVLPLTIYLLTFILSFSGEGRYNRPLFTLLLTISSVGIIYDLANPRLNFIIQIMIYAIFLFSACMIAHGELFRLRPKPSQLSKYYLLISAGGAIGGIFVNLIAPQIYNGYWEFHLGWILIFILLVALTFISPTKELKPPWGKRHDLATIFLTIIFLLLSLDAITTFSRNSLYQERNFYGVSKVFHNEYKDAYQYVNGSTIHGFQIISEDKRDLPTSYFWRDSGIAIVIRNHPQYANQMNVGVMGLGIGTLAAHGLPGDSYRFYEIDPIVIDLALGQEGYFSFLTDSAAEITIVPGDARVSLEQEMIQGERQAFDLLVMDAFSSDSVPVHLITLEAIEIYLEHMAPDGIIAINISNSYIDLTPVIWNIGEELGLTTFLIAPPVQEYHPIGIRSFWMFLVQDPAILDTPEINANADFLHDFQANIQLWTDDYSNLFKILRN
ncbi:MAG: fused MFS/spermidine synthase [Chloroflexota bacterium]